MVDLKWIPYTQKLHDVNWLSDSIGLNVCSIVSCALHSTEYQGFS